MKPVNQSSFEPWPEIRVRALGSQLSHCRDKQEILYSIWLHPMIQKLGYFPADIERELAAWTPGPFRMVDHSCAGERPDIVIFVSHCYRDEALALWELREALGKDTLIAVWMWDNHTDFIGNMKTALAADIVFFSHSSHSDYLYNPASAVCTHIPACSAQWTRASAEAAFRDCVGGERQHSLLMNYVNYSFASERNAVIADVHANIPEANVLLMPAGDRSRYFSQAPTERFAEWTQHKATLILPIRNDLSTRVFDALLAGLVPIVPTNIPDIDLLFSAETQQSLGIVRIDSYAIDEIRRAVDQALRNFDAMGPAGVLNRHQFVVQNHLLINRVTAMLHIVFQLIQGKLAVSFGDGPFGPALYVADAEQDAVPTLPSIPS